MNDSVEPVEAFFDPGQRIEHLPGVSEVYTHEPLTRCADGIEPGHGVPGLDQVGHDGLPELAG